MSSQQTHVKDGDGFFNGTEEPLTVLVEPYEGDKVAIHALCGNADGMTEPALSLYLSPVDAAVHAERILAAARSLEANREDGCP